MGRIEVVSIDCPGPHHSMVRIRRNIVLSLILALLRGFCLLSLDKHALGISANKSARILCPALFFLCISLVSCAKKEVLRPSEIGPYKGPVTVEVLKESVGFGKVKSIKALTGVTITKHGNPEGSLNGVLAYKAPGKMRIDLFGPFGLTVSEILLSPEVFQFYVPPKNTLYEWNSPGFTFSGLMNDGFSYEVEEEGDMYVLLAHKGGDGNSDIDARYYFDKTFLLNRSMNFYKDDSEILHAGFFDFSGRVPQRTKVVFSNGLEMDISLEEPEFDSDIPQDYFKPIDHGDKKIKSLQGAFKRFEPSR